MQTHFKQEEIYRTMHSPFLKLSILQKKMQNVLHLKKQSKDVLVVLLWLQRPLIMQQSRIGLNVTKKENRIGSKGSNLKQQVTIIEAISSSRIIINGQSL